MSEALRATTGIVAAIIGLAVLAVILSTRSNTSGVIGSAGNALAGIIGAATSPVTGAQVSAIGGGQGGQIASALLNPGGNQGFG